jgi:hypothetical protein
MALRNGKENNDSGTCPPRPASPPRIANPYGLPVAGENPGLNLPARLDTFYLNTTTTGMIASALAQALSCHFVAYYWFQERTTATVQTCALAAGW